METLAKSSSKSGFTDGAIGLAMAVALRPEAARG